ncbi:MAG: hypothetical protein H6655_03450 [Ardenticatenaceae bacterium]|nr:hypothetical protein [Ardenticatenaceae bacterium]
MPNFLLMQEVYWKVDPVEIDDYLRFKVINAEPLLSTIGTGTSTEKKSDQHSNLKLNEVLNEPLVLITGNAGTGKSTCLRYLCYQIASNPKSFLWVKTIQKNPIITIPIFISLKLYGNNNLLSLVRSQLLTNGIPMEINIEKQILGSNQCVILMDGIDEVQPKWKDDLTNEIAILSQSYPNLRIVITSRKQPRPKTLTGFLRFEIIGLTHNAILRFAEAYVGFYQRYKFMEFIERGRLEEVIQTPLFLALCLILYKQNAEQFESIADIYKGMLQLYKKGWEDRKKEFSHSAEWFILERFLAKLAFHMESYGFGNTIDRLEAINVFLREAQVLEKEFLWSNNNTLIDVTSQLLAHNLLEESNESISFWHASFRDYFTALYVSKFKIDEIIKFAIENGNSQIIAFLGGMLSNASPLVDHLIEKIHKSNNPYEPVNLLEALGLMGNKFTKEIIRAISEPNYYEVHTLGNHLLEPRKFEGKAILDDVLGTNIFIHELELGYIDFEQVEDFPDLDKIDFSVYHQLYRITLKAIYSGDLSLAKKGQEKLNNYIYSRIEEKTVDNWLKFSELSDIYIFRDSLIREKINSSELIEFCRNTIWHSSIPFLESIVEITEDSNLRVEAKTAIECIIRKI